MDALHSTITGVALCTKFFIQFLISFKLTGLPIQDISFSLSLKGILAFKLITKDNMLCRALNNSVWTCAANSDQVNGFGSAETNSVLLSVREI